MASNTAVFDSTVEQLQPIAGLESWVEPDSQHSNAGAPSWWERLIKDLAQEQPVPTKSQKERSAWKAAVKLGLRFRWDLDGTRLLADILAEYSVSSTQRELLKLMEDGLTPRELLVIYQLRCLWLDSTEFHASRGSWQCSTLTWETAFRLLRTSAFDTTADEVELLLWQLYERWWVSESLRRRHISFHSYLLFWLDGREEDSSFESIRPDFTGLDEVGWSDEDEYSELDQPSIQEWLNKFAA